MGEYPLETWLLQLDQMAVQTAALLMETEQVLGQTLPDAIPTTVADGSAANDSRDHGRPGVASPNWEQLLIPADHSFASAEATATAALQRVQEWKQRYASWRQLLEQLAAFLQSRSPPS